MEAARQAAEEAALTEADFREDGAAALEWAACYLERVEELSRAGPGEIFINHTRLDGRCVLRLAIGNARTTEATSGGRGTYSNEEARR